MSNLTAADRVRDRWVDVRQDGSTIVVVADLGNRFKIRLRADASLEITGGHPGQEVLIAVTQGEAGGYSLALNAGSCLALGDVILDTTLEAVTVWKAVKPPVDAPSPLWQVVGVPDLSTLYDAAGTAAAAIVTHVALADPHTQYLQRDADNVVDDNVDFAFSSGIGSKIGTGSTEKIGFWGATPVAQGSAIADAAGGVVIDAEARTALNLLLARERLIGNIAP